MKKIIAIAVIATITMASCSKDYTCTVSYEGMDDVVTNYTDLDKDAAEAAETSCDNAGAVEGYTSVWAEK